MLIARSPLRITLGGGGTDLPSYYREYEGFLIAAAIDKYVYITLTRPFTKEFISNTRTWSMSQFRKSSTPLSVRRECGLKSPHVEITTIADIPAGTGLG